MLPWLPLARWELEVDGVNATTAGFGRVTAQPYQQAPRVPFQSLNVFTVQCAELPDGGVAPRFQPGIHAVQVFARILGVAAPIASNTLQVDVVCTPPDAGAAGEVDAGVDAGSVPESDAGSVPADAGSPADGGMTASSCQPAAGAQSSCSSVAGIEVLGFALLWLFRRHRPARPLQFSSGPGSP